MQGRKKFLTGFSVSADSAEQTRYGKTVSDLQSAVSVAGGKITGTLKYVTGYTGFSSNPAEQEGNYLALAMEAAEGTEISVMLGEAGPVDLTEDKYLVVRLTDERKAQKLVFTATLDGVSDVRSFDLSGLTLEAEV